MSPPQRQPVIGFVGIHAGRRADQPVSQNETLARLFSNMGYRILRTSAVKRPSLRTAHQILSLLSWRNVDVVVVAVFSGQSFWIAELATRLGRWTGKRLVLFLHGGNLPVFGPTHRRWVERVLTRADVLLAPSDYLAETFRRWGLDVRVVPNVLNLDNYEFTLRGDPRPRLLWMRTFHPHYDPLMAVRVVARLSQTRPDTVLTMAGADHGELAAVRAEARKLGVEGRIRFVGYLDAEGKRRAFAEHDVFVNTNRVDNMPVSVLEAAASGLVPVATAVGGIPALLTDGIDGVLVPAGDDAAMADAITGLLSDPSRFARMSAGARRLAEQSGWPEVHRMWQRELALLCPGMVVP